MILSIITTEIRLKNRQSEQNKILKIVVCAQKTEVKGCLTTLCTKKLT